MKSNLYSRRKMVKLTGAALAVLNFSSIAGLASDKRRNYRIGACDWSIGKRSDLGSIALAEKIGLDGVQVDIGTVANKRSLWHPEGQRAYQRASEQYNVQVCSLSLGALNKVPYKSEVITEKWVCDSIDVAQAMGCKVILLPFFGKADLKGYRKRCTKGCGYLYILCG